MLPSAQDKRCLLRLGRFARASLRQVAAPAVHADVCSSGNVLADVLRQHAMNQCLVADVSAPRFRAEALQHLRIEANRDEPPRMCPKRGPPDAPHRAELCV